MPQCKRNGCREQAVPHGKRYCLGHMAEYQAKKREYHKRAAAAPKCLQCGIEPLLSERRVDLGLCPGCEKALAEHREAHRRQIAFYKADTVEALKDWMRSYLPGCPE